MKQPTTEQEMLKHEFTDEELRDLASALAKDTQDLDERRGEKKQVVKDYDSQIAAKESAIAVASRKYNNGYEIRGVKCETTFHDPEQGQATTTRMDTGEIVRVREMEQYETQEELPAGCPTLIS